MSSAALSYSIPLGQSQPYNRRFQIEGRPLEESARPTLDFRVVSPHYFETIGQRLVRGRSFEAGDQLGYLIVCEIRAGLTTPGSLLQEAEMRQAVTDERLPRVEEWRPDIQAMKFHVQALRFSMAQATLKWFPSLSLVGSWRITNEAGLTGRATNYSAGLSLSWALFDGFNRNADFRERKALAHLAELDMKAAKRNSRLELEDAMISLTSQQAAIRQAKVALDAAEKNIRETTELYRQGLGTALQVADANVRLFEAEVALVNARFGLGMAFLNLRAAEGKDPFGREVTVK